MNSNQCVLLCLVGVLLSGCCRAPAQGTSYRQQLGQITQMRETGAITEQEYMSLHSQIFHLMLH